MAQIGRSGKCNIIKINNKSAPQIVAGGSASSGIIIIQ